MTGVSNRAGAASDSVGGDLYVDPMAISKSIKGETCADGSAVGRVIDSVRFEKKNHDHWAIVTDRQHRVHRAYSARSIKLLADRLARSRLQGRCFAVASVHRRGGNEEAVVAEWRLNRIAERTDSCFFAWVELEADAVRSSRESAAA